MEATVQKEYVDYLKNVRLTQKNIDSIRHRSILEGKEIGIQEGKEIGIQEGEAIGIQKGEEKAKVKTVLKSFDNGAELSFIALITELSEQKVIEILRNHGKM